MAVAVPPLGNDRRGVDYRAVVDQVHRPDLYREVAKEMSLATPAGDRRQTLFDGVAFDPADPERYARGFAVGSIA